MKHLILVFCAFFSALITLHSQRVQFMPLNHAWSARLLADTDTLGHTQVRPLNPFVYGSAGSEMAKKMYWERPFGQDNWLFHTAFNNRLLDLEKEDFSLSIYPLFDVRLGNDSRRTNEQAYQNTRGVALEGRIGSNVAFYTDFVENQARFPLYVDEWISNERLRPQAVVPGQGVAKDFKDDPSQYDYGISTGWVNWNLNRFFNLQFGYGKNFIGEGYRSLLLSDNAFNYPYLRLQTRFWKIQYTNIFAQLQDVNTRLPDGAYPRKYMVSHYLSVKVGKKLNLGVYETVVYGDSLANRGLEWAYANPIIFYRPIEFAQGSRAGNVLMGLHASYRQSAKLHAYGQFVLDEFILDQLRAGDGWWGNKFGVQLGVKGQWKQPDLFYRIEFNTVRPYTYGHTKVLQNYAHYNQPLAHPLGGNFREILFQLNYYYQRWFVEGQLNYQTQGLDEDDTHWGSNVYRSNVNREMDTGNAIGQGVLAKHLLLQLRFGWIVNPSYNLRLEVGYLNRDFNPERATVDQMPNETRYLYLGLKTALKNTYLDF